MNLTECIDCGTRVSIRETIEVDLVRIGSGNLCEKCQKEHEGESEDQMAALIWDQMEADRTWRKEKRVRRIIKHGGGVSSVSDMLATRSLVMDEIVYGGLNAGQIKRLFEYVRVLEPRIDQQTRKEF